MVLDLKKRQTKNHFYTEAWLNCCIEFENVNEVEANTSALTDDKSTTVINC